MYRTVLVPLDGSPFGEHALPWALRIARESGATLRLLHVHQSLRALYQDGNLLLDEDLDRQLKQRHLQYLGSTAERLRRQAPVDVKVDLLEDEVAPAIRATATSWGADLVVMTTHGRGPLGRLWLGSVADELLRDLPMPLLLVRPHETAPDLAQEPVLRHILLPLDGSAFAEQMIEPAVALGSLTGAAYTLLRVVPLPTLADYHLEATGVAPLPGPVLEQIDRLQAKLRQEAGDYLERVAARLRQRSLRVQTRLASDYQPAAAILQEATPPAADLIALGTHGRRGLSRLFRGSVADKVIRGAAVPVLVHRPVYLGG
jgi:nucleotide-binding universal stress UspA family protein